VSAGLPRPVRASDASGGPGSPAVPMSANPARLTSAPFPGGREQDQILDWELAALPHEEDPPDAYPEDDRLGPDDDDEWLEEISYVVLGGSGVPAASGATTTASSAATSGLGATTTGPGAPAGAAGPGPTHTHTPGQGHTPGPGPVPGPGHTPGPGPGHTPGYTPGPGPGHTPGYIPGPGPTLPRSEERTSRGAGRRTR
jgi:hypothetical protein